MKLHIANLIINLVQFSFSKSVADPEICPDASRNLRPRAAAIFF